MFVIFIQKSIAFQNQNCYFIFLELNFFTLLNKVMFKFSLHFIGSCKYFLRVTYTILLLIIYENDRLFWLLIT